MPFDGTGHSGDHIFHGPGAKPRKYAAELRILSDVYPLRGSAFTDNITDNLFMFMFNVSLLLAILTPNVHRQVTSRWP